MISVVFGFVIVKKRRRRLDKFLLSNENYRQIIHLCCVWLSETWVVEPSLLSARGPSGDKYFVFNHLVRTICQAFHRSACSQLVGSQRCQRVRVKCALWKPVDDLGPSGMPKKMKHPCESAPESQMAPVATCTGRHTRVRFTIPGCISVISRFHSQEARWFMVRASAPKTRLNWFYDGDNM